MRQPERLSMLLAIVRELNILHVLLVLYCIPIVVGFVVLTVGIVVLAFYDPGFTQFLIFTMIVGLVLGLPAALRP